MSALRSFAKAILLWGWMSLPAVTGWGASSDTDRLLQFFGGPGGKGHLVDPTATQAGVPMTFTNKNLILVAVTLNGREAVQLQLDTGAEFSSLAPSVVDRLGVEKQLLGYVGGVGTTQAQRNYVIRLSLLQAGGLIFKDYMMMSHTMPGYFEGFLGYSFLAPYVVEMDFLQSRMTLYRHGSYHPPSSALTLEMPLAGKQPVLDVDIPGVGIAHLAIDTGFYGTWMLFRPFVRRHGLVERPSRQVWQGTGGEESGGAVTLPEVRVSHITLSQVEAGVIHEVSTRFDGLVGLVFFLRFKGVAFDYRRKKMYLIPKPWLGVAFGAGARVRKVEPDGPADRAWIEVGDVVTRLDGQDMKTSQAVITALAGKAVGAVITLDLQRGKETVPVTLTLEPSFR